MTEHCIFEHFIVVKMLSKFLAQPSRQGKIASLLAKWTPESTAPNISVWFSAVCHIYPPSRHMYVKIATNNTI